MSNNFVVSDKRDEEIQSRRNIESLFGFISEIHNSASFQTMLLIAEAEALNFQDEANFSWRSYPQGSSVRSAGANHEAVMIQTGLAQAERNGLLNNEREPKNIFGVERIAVELEQPR